jgi:hypothetical protein
MPASRGGPGFRILRSGLAAYIPAHGSRVKDKKFASQIVGAGEHGIIFLLIIYRDLPWVDTEWWTSGMIDAFIEDYLYDSLRN